MGILAATNVNFAGSWTSLWAKISGTLGTLTTLIATIGMLLVVGSIIGYIWERRRGGSNHSKLIYTLLIGGILAAPTFLIPAILHLVDFLVNTIGTAL